MLSLVVDSVNLLFSALLVGAMFCVWLVFNPSQLDASHYIILQQQGIRTLHPTMPGLGALTILLTFASAVLARESKMRMSLLIGTAILFIISGLITRFANMPINAIVRGWNSAAPPDHWTALRDAWWRWHCWRLCSALGGLVLLIIATLMRRPSTIQSVAISVCRPPGDVLMRTISLLL
ncbi:MAG TPA: DUF1772 domain-containing protein [Terracidiphilus sp.]|jgi:anthrone oxygenase-like protein|nr:DUF1772 domain-containing protein [Terracidiphilus sp.]